MAADHRPGGADERRQSRDAARTAAAASLLILGALAGCRSLADHKEGPSRAELESAKLRLDRARDLVIENQLASDDDAEKDFWRSLLRALGDFRDRLTPKAQR